MSSCAASPLAEMLAVRAGCALLPGEAPEEPLFMMLRTVAEVGSARDCKEGSSQNNSFKLGISQFDLRCVVAKEALGKFQ